MSIKIEKLGKNGDGAAIIDGREIFIPYTMPGDEIEPTEDGYKITKQSVERQNAKCIHFTKCGGCSLQHLNEQKYYQFKNDIVANVIQKLNSEIKPEKIVKTGYFARRRVNLKLAKNKDQINIGFFARKSNQVIDIKMCPVIKPEIFDLAIYLKEYLGKLKQVSKIKEITIGFIDNWLDVGFILDDKLKARDLELLKNIPCEKVKRIYLVSNNEIITLKSGENITVKIAQTEATLPAGAFLQASKEAETAMINFILENTKESKNIIEFFCGIGTYTIALAKKGKKITAYEGSYDMVMALNSTARTNNLESNIFAKQQDLMKNPVKELDSYDTAVINPPRAGASSQVKQIAKGRINKIIMVSCNPNSFLKDAKTLQDSGFTLEKIMPVDQFYQSAHLEIVASFVSA